MSEYNEEIISDIIRIKEVKRGSIFKTINRRNKKYIEIDIAIPKKIILEIYALEEGVVLNDFLTDKELEDVSEWQEKIAKKQKPKEVRESEPRKSDNLTRKTKKSTTKKESILFISLDYFEGPIYPQIVKELNKAFKYKLNTSIFFLCRKILENYIIDVLKINFPDKKALWQYTKKNHDIVILGLKRLIENLCKERSLLPKANLSSYQTNIQDFKEKLDEIKDMTNPTIHSLAITPQDRDVLELKDLINSVFPILYRLKN